MSSLNTGAAQKVALAQVSLGGPMDKSSSFDCAGKVTEFWDLHDLTCAEIFAATATVTTRKTRTSTDRRAPLVSAGVLSRVLRRSRRALASVRQ